MPGSGTRTFFDPDHYEAGLRQVQLERVIASGGAFKARLTWAELQHTQLLRCEEEFAGREDEGVLLVPKAGEMLFRLKHPPKWAGGNGE